MHTFRSTADGVYKIVKKNNCSLKRFFKATDSSMEMVWSPV